SFRRDDVTPPPARGFRHEVGFEDGDTAIVFEASPGDGNIPGTSRVTLRYRVGDGVIESREMTPVGGTSFRTDLQGISPGTRLQYWFQQQIGLQSVESIRFDHVAGEETPESPAADLIARTSGRFRDRHPNEWRFDHYVENYDGGKTFEIEITDRGDSLDLVVTTDPDGGPERVDVGYFIQSGPGEMCERPLTVSNLVMVPEAERPHVFRQRIPDVTFGQIVEFDLTHIGVPNPAGGTFQYYTEFFHYHVGRGWFGTARSNPRAHAAGRASIDRVTAPRFSFAQHATNLELEELNRFMEGKTRFETDHAEGVLLNFPTSFACCTETGGVSFPPSPHAQFDQLGPRFNETSCIGCHLMDGRGATPTGTEDNLSSLVLHLSLGIDAGSGRPIPHPDYGLQFDTNAVDGIDPEGRLTVEYELVEGTFDDGTPYELRRPIYRLHDTLHGSPGSNLPDAENSPGHPGPVEASPRIAPMLAGTGLLEAVDEEAILALEDPGDLDGDGISGRANRVRDLETNRIVLGRFGWKASQPSLLQQTAIAYQRDLGLTSPLTPRHDCGVDDGTCVDHPSPELTAEDVELVADYVRGLVPPPRRNHEDPEAIAGMHLFKRANCQACHVPTLRTRKNHPIAAYRDESIQPFTDLLLHDLGPGLADGFRDHEAGGSEWRTAPLWGAEFVGHAQGRPTECTDPFSGEPTPNYLHDGRARTLMEAILWHGGEAADSRDTVLAMTAEERSALLAFVAYPFADPALEDSTDAPCPADVDGDGRVDGRDLATMLETWGGTGPGDLNGDGSVDAADLGLLFIAWGACP
ncbi:MAG: di-heme oxidoredictase family protein, partial [Planctomycetota bacterium]|nr:di-heme oxidoredictase family protein [Planctomycetota bacterium]